MARRGQAGLPEGWDFGADQRPPRAVLVGAEPIGIGTPQVESLTSFVKRIAVANQLPASDIARFVLAPVLGRESDKRDWGRYFSAIFRGQRGSLNGLERYASTWVAALETVTLLPDLEQLTMLPVEGLLWSRCLNRAELRFCPECWDDDRAARRPIYERLIWTLVPLTACPAHQAPLVAICAACGARQAQLTAWAVVGRCGRCGAALRRPKPEPRREPVVDPEWQPYVGHQLGSLLADAARLTAVERPADRQAAMANALERSGLSMTRFAKRTGYSLAQVSLWCAGRRLPSIEGALRICAVADLALPDLLAGATRETTAVPAAPASIPPSPERQRRVDWQAVERLLRDALETDPPPALHALLRGHGFDEKRVAKQLPGLHGAVRDRHAAWRAAGAAKRRRTEASRVRAATRRLWAQGMNPTRERVREAAGDLPSMRDPHVQVAWKDTLRELGLL